jgi:hypothetical protein
MIYKKISAANLTTNSSLDLIKNNGLCEFKDSVIRKSLNLITGVNIGLYNQTEVYIKEIL